MVSHQEAARHGRPIPMVLPFGIGRDGTKLVADYLARADAAHASHVADLAVVIQTRRDDQVIECRSEVVPEAVAAPPWQPAVDRVVAMNPLVTQIVTEWVYRCRPYTTSHTRPRIETEEQCSMVVRAVPRSRTAWSWGGRGRDAKVIPYTDFYTEYRSVRECGLVPVLRTGTEEVTQTRCAPELETRTVTRHEFQLEQQYIPGHFEAFTRQRLRELEPVCYVPETVPSGQPRNRLQGVLFGVKPRRAD